MPKPLSHAECTITPLEPRTLFTALPHGFVDTTVITGLSAPTAETVAPDGRVFIAEKAGALRVVKNGQLLATPFLTVSVDTFSERGLDGVALDPNFNTNGYVYVYYTVADPNNPGVRGNAAHNRLSRFTVDAGHPDVALSGSERVLLDNIPSTNGNHNGGSLVFGADGMLYLGVGEAGVSGNAQTLANLNGKILRLDVEHPANLIPSDNPFVGRKGARGEIWAYGFRNPFTAAVQPGTGKIFVNDVGSNGGKTREEVNPLQKGGNYGWPVGEGVLNRRGFVDPLYAYAHVSSNGGAITGGLFYTANQFPPQWSGKYFLADFDENFVRAVDPATGVETDFATGADAPVDLDAAPGGGIYYLSVTGSLREIRYTGPDVTPPLATLTTARRLRQAGGRYYNFNVTYADGTAVSAATLDNADLLVTGPNGFSRYASFFSATPAGNAGSIVATYGIKAPGGTWDPTDDAVYNVVLAKRAVRDTLGNPTPAQVLGAFSVRISLAARPARVGVPAVTRSPAGTFFVAKAARSSVFEDVLKR